MYAGGGAAGCAIASAEKSAPMAHRGTTTDRSLIVRFILVPSPDESSGPLRPPLIGRGSTRTLQKARSPRSALDGKADRPHGGAAAEPFVAVGVCSEHEH